MTGILPSVSRTTRISPASALLISGFLLNASAQHTTVIAKSGDAPRDHTETLFEIGSHHLTNSGKVYFTGNLRDNGVFVSAGLFQGNGEPDGLAAMVLSGDPTPDHNGNVAGIGNTHYRANSSGKLVTHLTLGESTGGFSDNSGIYEVNPLDRSLTQIARKGELVTDGESQTFTRTPLHFSLNEAGQVIFASSLVNSAIPFFGYAVSLYENGSETGLFQSGQRTPGDDGSYQSLSIATIPRLNEAGQVVLNVSIVPDDPVESRSGIFLADSGGITTVAREDQATPSGNGTFNTLTVTTPAIGNGGQVAFWSQVQDTSGGTSDNTAIFLFEGSSLTEIARRGDLLPDDNGRYLELFNLVDVNQGGEVLFHSRISGASGGSDEGIFVGTSSTTRVVVRVGEEAPSGGSLGDLIEESIRFNDQGQIFFAAIVDTPEAAGTLALFLHDPTLGLLEIAREQDEFQDLGTITQLIPNLREQASDPIPGTLNASGQVAYRAFIGGDAVVLLWTPPAEAGRLVLPPPTIAKSGTGLLLRWPITDFPLLIESTTQLPDEDSWSARPEIEAIPNGDFLEAQIPAKEPREFFRLRRPN